VLGGNLGEFGFPEFKQYLERRILVISIKVLKNPL
jgi:hypothetical protein